MVELCAPQCVPKVDCDERALPRQTKEVEAFESNAIGFFCSRMESDLSPNEALDPLQAIAFDIAKRRSLACLSCYSNVF